MNSRVVLAVVLVALALWTAKDFLPALIWATIFAIALWPLYIKFAARFSAGSSSLSAFIFTVIVALILFTPMALAAYQIAQQGDVIVGWLKQAKEIGVEVPEWVARLPVAAESMQQWWRANLSDPKAASAWLQTINADSATDLFRNFGGQLLHRLFMLLFSLRHFVRLAPQRPRGGEPIPGDLRPPFRRGRRRSVRENGRCNPRYGEWHGIGRGR